MKKYYLKNNEKKMNKEKRRRVYLSRPSYPGISAPLIDSSHSISLVYFGENYF